MSDRDRVLLDTDTVWWSFGDFIIKSLLILIIMIIILFVRLNLSSAENYGDMNSGRDVSSW